LIDHWESVIYWELIRLDVCIGVLSVLYRFQRLCTGIQHSKGGFAESACTYCNYKTVKNTSKYTSTATSAVDRRKKEHAFSAATSSKGAAASILRNAYAATMGRGGGIQVHDCP
jgi:hypothetical protein